MTHVLSLKMKLNARHANAKAMPAVASMENMTVRERSTETSSLDGTPSYGTPPGKVKLMKKLEKIEERKYGSTNTEEIIGIKTWPEMMHWQADIP